MWEDPRRLRVGNQAGSAGGLLRVHFCRSCASSCASSGASGPEFIYINFSGGLGFDFICTNVSCSRGLDLSTQTFGVFEGRKLYGS